MFELILTAICRFDKKISDITLGDISLLSNVFRKTDGGYLKTTMSTIETPHVS